MCFVASVTAPQLATISFLLFANFFDSPSSDHKLSFDLLTMICKRYLRESQIGEEEDILKICQRLFFRGQIPKYGTGQTRNMFIHCCCCKDMLLYCLVNFQVYGVGCGFTIREVVLSVNLKLVKFVEITKVF